MMLGGGVYTEYDVEVDVIVSEVGVEIELLLLQDEPQRVTIFVTE